jgi:endonuclease/exonuclease/phosphatase (EEP) superfamily protein YafD
MPDDLASQVAVVSLNTRGIAPFGSHLAERYAAIGAALDVGDADVACFQELFTWWHLRLLARRMRSFRQVSFRPSAVGPAGGLATFSRRPVSGTAYHGFGSPPAAPGISRAMRLDARLKGILVTRLARPELRVINVHPAANRDGDWSQGNRFYPLHRAQLAALARVVRGAAAPAVVCGDFNVDRGSSLFGQFITEARLADAFNGSCPATFHTEYLPSGKTPHCIDFILISDGVKAEAATVVFADKEPLPGGPGYISDHLGLRARLVLGGDAATRP